MLGQALQKVFRHPAYVVAAAAIGSVLFILATWLPNLGLIGEVMISPNTPFTEKFNLPISLIGTITTNFTGLSASYTIAIAILFGIDVAMVTYYMRHRVTQSTRVGVSSGILGLVSGVIGMGCAACGALLLTSILSLVGATSVLLLLPLRGGEFGIIGVIVLCFSIYKVAEQIQKPNVCT